jgi:hypothetical protein
MGTISMRLRFASLLLLVALAACQTVTVTPRPGAASAPPKDAHCTLEFWSGAERPRRAMDDLAEVKVVKSSAFDSHELMRQKACALGADAIVDLHEELGPDAARLVGTAVRYLPL